MKILVLGGLGFIGLNFVKLLASERSQWKITVGDAQTYAAHDPIVLKEFREIAFKHVDIRDYATVDLLISENDVVVNFAAESHNDNSIANPSLFYETNLMGAFNVAEACRKYSKRIHHVSTDEVFGDMELTSIEKFNNESPYRPSSPYSASKAAADLMFRAWHRTYGLKLTISNCTNNFGEYQHSEKLIPSVINRIKNGLNPEIYGDGKNIRDWIHVMDHCRGILLAVEKGKIGETYLFGSNDEVSNATLVKELIRSSGRRDVEINFIKDRPGHDLRYALSSDKAVAELGWTPMEPKILDSTDWLISLYSQL